MWETNSVQSGHDAMEAAKAAADARNYSGASGYTPETTTGVFKKTTTGPQVHGVDLGGGSVVGINAEKVEGMRTEIRNYVGAIETHLKNIAATDNSNNAFKSEDIKNAMEKYIASVKTYCINLTSNLLSFSDKLQDVKESWEKSAAAFASGSVGASANAVEGATTKYQDNR